MATLHWQQLPVQTSLAHESTVHPHPECERRLDPLPELTATLSAKYGNHCGWMARCTQQPVYVAFHAPRLQQRTGGHSRADDEGFPVCTLCARAAVTRGEFRVPALEAERPTRAEVA